MNPPKPLRGQKSLPFATREEALADMYERIVRMESKLTKLLLHVGLDENGYPAVRKRLGVSQPREPQPLID